MTNKISIKKIIEMWEITPETTNSVRLISQNYKNCFNNTRERYFSLCLENCIHYDIMD